MLIFEKLEKVKKIGPLVYWTAQCTVQPEWLNTKQFLPSAIDLDHDFLSLYQKSPEDYQQDSSMDKKWFLRENKWFYWKTNDIIPGNKVLQQNSSRSHVGLQIALSRAQRVSEGLLQDSNWTQAGLEQDFSRNQEGFK